MSPDEIAIRGLIDTWLVASAAGDLERVLTLMSEDVVFLTPGRPPMRGRAEFAAASRQVEGKFRIEGRSEVRELEIIGNRAWLISYLTVIMTPVNGGASIRRSGHTLTILRKEAAGNWVIARDANLLAVDSAPVSPLVSA